jgi:hypothetical protein
MKLVSSQRTASITEPVRPDSVEQSSHQCFYQLLKSLDRYRYFKKWGAPDILVDAEKVLIRRRLLFLFNLCGDRKKYCQNCNIHSDN